MTMKSLLRDAIVSSLVPVEFPDNEGLVSAGGQNHLRVLGVGGDLSHPAIVASQRSPQLQGLSHPWLRPFLKNCSNNSYSDLNIYKSTSSQSFSMLGTEVFHSTNIERSGIFCQQSIHI